MFELIIIGAGIAGQTAAIYASRKRMHFLLLTADVGGQFLESGEVLNYPGIIRTDGASFSSLMEKQLQFNKVKPHEDEPVTHLEKIPGGFRVSTGKKSYAAKTIIIASGARARKLNVPGEEKLAKKGVTYCAVCDGPLFAGKDIAIIGGGNSALEAVDFTHKIARKIYLVNIEKSFIAHEYLIDRIHKLKNVEVITEAKTKKILGEQSVTGLVYEKNGKEKTIKVQGVIIEIGRVPNTEFCKGFVDLDEHTHIKIDEQTRTSVPGVFAAGDCASGHEYQYVIAAGQGCIALLKAARFLANQKA